ncbi:hydrolase 1, exosortase A system-associated [Massilia sp. YMA4]|uniref:hydrolase 1, exosortase A system-associated n=1 Tax=Massilia sp. YMA4 TaxID=1593482 RepID=UPI000DD10CAA|nr:hydrolase 1, exosortase A system-associated [Massilia sp. YMA4]AXA93095.1 hydrolase 1, exosortase A system-associated [Massilia sp. YMA4]
MQPDEQALCFPCDVDWLTAVLSPIGPGALARRGVLIVVGGPQYRAGSHRQFALLARSLAAAGIPAMRFDYRGMGDSGGDPRTFEAVDLDLRTAIDRFIAAVPGMQEVVLWGLCDAASAALFYARHDRRVAGLVLANPWARTSDGLARATLKHYYVARLLQPAFWKKLVSGRFDVRGSLGSLVGLVRSARGGAAPAVQVPSPAAPAPGLRERMLAGWQGFRGPILLITSGADLTAQEFLDMVKASRPWQKLLADPRVQRQTLAAADHTFSRREWRDQVAGWTAAWVRSW